MSSRQFTSSSYQQSSSRQASSNEGRNVEGELADILGDRAATLQWSSQEGDKVILSGGSDFSQLNGFKGALLALRNDFFGQGSERITIQGEKREELDRRMLLLEHEIDGLLKRRINFSVRDKESGHRVMDYTGLLNEKENQIVELEKKIQNLEERLRRASLREKELEDEIVRLHTAMKSLSQSNVSKVDLERILQVSTESRQALENLERLQGQLLTLSLIHI